MYHLPPDAAHSLREYLRDARAERLLARRRYFTPNPLLYPPRRVVPKRVPNVPYRSDAGSLR